jgi:tetratricopeptide (TPR) repeat protein
MKTPIATIALIAILLFAASCSAQTPHYANGLSDFVRGDYRNAAKNMEALKEKTNDQDYPIYMLDLGYANEMAGDARKAEACYLAGIRAMEQKLSGGAKTVNFVAPAAGRYYRGDQYERVFSHVFLGRAYFRLGQWDDARIEFQKADEEDISANNRTEHDVALAHYLAGETFLQMDNANDAAVAFRNVNRFRPEFPYGYLELAKLEQRRGDEAEAKRLFAKYRERDKNAVEMRLEPDDAAGTLVVLVDLGDGPYRNGYALNRKFRAGYSETGARITIGGRSWRTYRLDEVFPHAKHEAGKVVHTLKDASLSAARIALEAWVAKETGANVFVDEGDSRRFDFMPGEFQLAQIPLAPGAYSARIALERNSFVFGGRDLPRFTIEPGRRTYVFAREWTGWSPPSGQASQARR